MPEHRWLILRLEAPLLAFGGVAIDHLGVTRDFPAASMVTGLLANALGYRRTEQERHQALQDRLVFAALLARSSPGDLLTDTQNARLEKGDKGWTTWGFVEMRGGNSYEAPHRRRRDYHMDAAVIVALRLQSAEDSPGLDEISAALDRPARPLFLGRKPCLPSARLNSGFVSATTAYEALIAATPERTETGALAARALWPLGEGPDAGDNVDRIHDLPDLRSWRTGLHGGARRVVEGRLHLSGGKT